MDRKDQDPEDPVDEHGVPDTQHAHVQYKDEHMCKTDTENPYGDNGNDQGKGCRSGCPEIIGKGKGQRPYDHGNRVGQDQIFRQAGGRCRQMIPADNQSSAEKHRCTDNSEQHIIDHNQQPGIVSGLFFSPALCFLFNCYQEPCSFGNGIIQVSNQRRYSPHDDPKKK